MDFIQIILNAINVMSLVSPEAIAHHEICVKNSCMFSQTKAIESFETKASTLTQQQANAKTEIGLVDFTDIIRHLDLSDRKENSWIQIL